MGAFLAVVLDGVGQRLVASPAMSSGGAPGPWFWISQVGFPEEVLKLLPVLVVARWSSIVNEPFDLIFYGAVSALGFATVENSLYFAEYGAGIAFGRFVFSTAAHLTWAGTVCYWWARRREAGDGRPSVAIVQGLVVAAVIHGAFDWIVTADGLIGDLLRRGFLPLTMLLMAVLGSELTWGLNHSPFFRDDLAGAPSLENQSALWTMLVVLLTASYVADHAEHWTEHANLHLLLNASVILVAGAALVGALGRFELHRGEVPPLLRGEFSYGRSGATASAGAPPAGGTDGLGAAFFDARHASWIAQPAGRRFAHRWYNLAFAAAVAFVAGVGLLWVGIELGRSVPRELSLQKDGVDTSCEVVTRHAGARPEDRSVTCVFLAGADPVKLRLTFPTERYKQLSVGARIGIRYLPADPSNYRILEHGGGNFRQLGAMLFLPLGAMLALGGFSMGRRAFERATVERRLERAGVLIPGRAVDWYVAKDEYGFTMAMTYSFTSPSGRELVGRERFRKDLKDGPEPVARPPGTAVWIAYADDECFRVL